MECQAVDYSKPSKQEVRVLLDKKSLIMSLLDDEANNMDKTTRTKINQLLEEAPCLSKKGIYHIKRDGDNHTSVERELQYAVESTTTVPTELLMPPSQPAINEPKNDYVDLPEKKSVASATPTQMNASDPIAASVKKTSEDNNNDDADDADSVKTIPTIKTTPEKASKDTPAIGHSIV